MLISNEIEILVKEGWVKKNLKSTSKSELIEIGRKLGEPVSSRAKGDLVDELRPLAQIKANRNSLSSLYGTGSFPLHTDTAYKRTPVRYILLYAKKTGAGNRVTFLTDGFQSIDNNVSKTELESTVFKIKNGKYSFLGSMLCRSDLGEYFIRLDQGCMVPATRESRVVFHTYLESLDQQPKIEVNWEEGDLLIIDNWRMLHGRGPSLSYDADRLLYRMNVQ
jgi:alpha-ketoglutarate-dependent taurine dioxygenase